MGIRPFQLAAFKAAVHSRRPICPVAVRGALLIYEITLSPLAVASPCHPIHLISPELEAASRGGGKGVWKATGEIIARHSGEPLL